LRPERSTLESFREKVKYCGVDLWIISKLGDSAALAAIWPAEPIDAFFTARRIGSDVPMLQVTLSSSDTYFGARRLAVMDQLGSNVSSGTFFPWGEAKGGYNPQDTWNFATYWQDSASGLDYANNRYYSNAYGRFMTPDPSKSSDAKSPLTWNHYGYSYGDPVNNLDPSGLDPCGSSTSVSSSGVISVTVYDCLSIPTGWDENGPGAGWGAYNNQYDTGKVATYQWEASNMSLHGQTTNALTSLSSQCQSAIGTSNLNKTLQNVNNLVFLNGTLASQGNWTGNQLLGNGSNTPIGTLVAESGAAAIVLLTASGAQTNDIVLGAQYYSATQGQQMALLVHEALHSGLNLGDLALAAALNLSLPSNATIDDASSAISDFFYNNCPKSMQNQ
jgi:RHS repeat-associated protein